MKNLVFRALAGIGLGAFLLPGRAAGPLAQDPLRPRLMVQHGHSLFLVTASFSPDGKLALTAGGDGIAKIWSAETGKELVRLEGHEHGVSSAAFSPDGTRVLTSSYDKTARVWDPATGTVLASMVHQDEVSWAAWSRDGKRVITESKGVSRLWNVVTGTSPSVLAGWDHLEHACFSPDGQRIAAGGWDHAVRIWDADGKTQLAKTKPHEDRITSIGFSPDSKRVVTASVDGTARIWDVASGHPLGVIQGQVRGISSAAFSPDGKWIVTADETVRIWDATTCARQKEFEVKSKTYSSAYFSPNGKQIIASSNDGTASIWDVATGKLAVRLAGQSIGVDDAFFSPDGKQLITASSDRTARVWNLESGRQIWKFGGYSSWTGAATFSPDGSRLLTTDLKNAAAVRDAFSGKELRRLEHKDRVEKAAFSPNGRRIVTASLDGTYGLWDASTGRQIAKLPDRPGQVLRPLFSPDSTRVLTLSDSPPRPGRVITLKPAIWDGNTGRRICELDLEEPVMNIMSASFSPDGEQLATASLDGVTRVWDTTTGQTIRSLMEGNDIQTWNNHVLYSPSGKRIVTAGSSIRSEPTAQIWDAESGNPVAQMAGHRRWIRSIAYSKDGSRIVTASGDGTARIWHAESGALTFVLKSPTFAVGSASFSPDGRFVVTTHGDGAARLWDARTGKELVSIVSFKDGSWFVADPEGRFDTSNLDEIPGAVWVLPSEPFRAIAPEVFMREYYTPGLLARTIRKEAFAPVRNLAQLDRSQPTLNIQVQPGSTPSQADVTVAMQPSSSKGPSGIRDLRLFRDGSLIGWKDGVVAQDKVTFKGIPLPSGATQVNFRAHCFNLDRVKSANANALFRPRQTPPRQERIAYLVCVGLNRYEDTSRFANLSFALNDAKSAKTTIPPLSLRSQSFSRVQPVLLESSLARRTATKDAFRAVLERLAGKPVKASRLAGIAGADKLKKAGPDDLVLIYWSGHGDTDKKRTFYLIPSDNRPRRGGNPSEKWISSEELSMWLRPIDAGQMAMVIDACHSAASVQRADFKPGPMGDRGLGQLAYDKGMLVLAASQPEQFAIETGGMGLLSSALVKEGLIEKKAGRGPVTLKQWLEYAVGRVPERYRLAIRGIGVSKSAKLTAGGKTASALSHQQPVLFDFRRKATPEPPFVRL